jgi:porphobilinogen synthase
MQEAIRAIKAVCPEMIVMPDVALDPILWSRRYYRNGEVANDATSDALVKWPFLMQQQELILLRHLMDGRVLRLREGLDAAGFHNVGIMSYSAKYASAFYGHFVMH